MSSILEVHNLVKKYGDFTAVKGISFEIKDGEIFSLLGPNGAGKTTTISMLSTLYTPTSGDATIAGHSITKNPMAVKGVIGVVPQEIALYEDLTARENLLFWGQMYGLGGKALNSRIDAVLEQIGLTDKARNRVKTYSGGMKRRVNIGVGLLHKPRLLASALATATFGTTMGTFIKTERQAGGLSVMFGMVFALMGGCWYPLELFPPAIQNAVRILPTTWAMQGMLDLVLRGGALQDILPEAGVLLGFAIVFFSVGVWRFRYE